MTFACKSKDGSATTFSEVGHNTRMKIPHTLQLANNCLYFTEEE